MASKVLLATFLLVCVGVCYGRHHLKYPQGDETSSLDQVCDRSQIGGASQADVAHLRNMGNETVLQCLYALNDNSGNPEPVCTGECPEFELLCSTPEYDVRRYKSALWVSTTMSDLSLSQASGRGRKRLHDYFGGANDKRLKMSYTAPLVTQTRIPPESPIREITVSMPLPRKVAKNPPKPTDPRVVIDLVPETIMYVKKFRGRSARVGFVADQEAKNFFKTLKTNDEIVTESGGYYYVVQYGSSSTGSHGHGRQIVTEIAVFAMNEVAYKWLEFHDLTAEGQGLPKCLRGKEEPMVWGKMDQSDIPLLTREQCSTTYDKGRRPKVETEEVKGIDDKSIQLKHYKDIKALAYVPPTCHYDTAIHASASPLMMSLNTSDFSPSDHAMTITVAMEKREELDGKKSCQKFFKVMYAGGGGNGTQEEIPIKKKAGFQTPKTVEALHHGQTPVTRHYSKCFGGNAFYEPSTITSTAKILMERLRDKKKCFLGDHVSVVEYHDESRLFDRYNEINLDADLDCSDQEGRPPFTFHLPVSKDYSRSEVKPSLGDQCVTHECAEHSVIMRLENNLKLIDYAPEKWFHAKGASKSCSNGKAFRKAVNSLLRYVNGKNEDNATIDVTKPLYAKLNMSRSGPSNCDLVTTVSTSVPENITDDTPKPIDDTVAVRPGVRNSFFLSLYKTKFSPDKLRQHIVDVSEELDSLKPFGLEYDTENIWLGAYSSSDEGVTLFELAIPRKTASKDEQDGEASTGASDDKELKEDTSDENIPLPKPEGCSESVCPTVYVTKNHSNFMELRLPNRKSVCHQTKLCGGLQVSGRQLMRPILGYLNGDNSANEKINNFAVPLFKTRVYSAEEEEKGIPPCEREYQACVRLPDEYKEIPEPNTEGLSIFTADGDFHGYGIAVKGYVTEPVASEAIWTLMQTLDQENVPYDKTWVAYFSYDKPLTNPEEKTSYFLFIKKGEDIGEEPAEGDTNETEN